MNNTDFARALASEAGALLLRLRATSGLTGFELGALGDCEANKLIVSTIARAFPDDGLLSEEMADDAARLGKKRVWIVDPLDGTREYSEGRDDWAVHIGLVVDGEPSTGAVALPAGHAIYTAGDAPSVDPDRRQPVIAVSRTRPPQQAAHVAQALDGLLLPMGSAGAKAMAVMRGDADIYLHDGGLNQWDSCAPVAVARSAGLHCSRIDGSPLAYNAASPICGSLLICRPRWTAGVLDALGSRIDLVAGAAMEARDSPNETDTS